MAVKELIRIYIEKLLANVSLVIVCYVVHVLMSSIYIAEDYAFKGIQPSFVVSYILLGPLIWAVGTLLYRWWNS